MSNADKIIKGTSTVLLMHVIGGLVAYVFRLFAARNLTVGEFGLLYAILSFIGFLTLFRDLGFGPTLTKFIAEFSAKNDRQSIKSTFLIVVGAELLAGIIIASVVFLLADYISISYFKTDASTPLKIITASFTISAFFVMQYVFQGLGKIKYYASVEPIRNVITLCAAVAMVGMGLTGFAYGYLVGALLASVLMFVLVLRVFPLFSTGTNLTPALAKRIVAFSAPVFFTSIGGTILGYTDTLAITFFLSTNEVGLYQAALPTAQILWVFAGSISIVLLPLASSLKAKNDVASLSRLISGLLKFSFIFTIPVVIIIMAFPDIIIRLLFGESFLAAAPALQILSLTALFYALFAITSPSILGVGNPTANMKIVSMIGIFDLVLNIIFIPVLGITGAALTTLFSYFLGAVVSVAYLKKEVKFTFQWIDMSKAFLGGVVAFFIILVLKERLYINAWAEAFIALIIASCAYLALLYVSRAVTKEELRMLKDSGVPVPERVIRLFG